jgi:hypothetical protein
MAARDGRPPPGRARRPGQEAAHLAKTNGNKREVHQTRHLPQGRSRPSPRLLKAGFRLLAPSQGGHQ